MAAVIKIFVFLFVVLLSLDSLIFENHIYYELARDFRKNANPELYDATYLPNALWPQEGGSTFEASVSFQYRGKEYVRKRNIRCYRDVSFGSSTNKKYVWRSGIAMLPVSLDDGSLFYTIVPKVCDLRSGLSRDEVVLNKPFFKYINSAQNPTYIETLRKTPFYGGNSAYSKNAIKVNPNSVVVRAIPMRMKRAALTSNRGDGKTKALFTEMYGHLSQTPTVPYILYSSVTGSLFFEEQWKVNSKLVELIENVNRPTIIPVDLLAGLQKSPGITPEARIQVSNFYKKYDLKIINLNLTREFTTGLHLREEGRWIASFGNIGFIREYRRRCENQLKTCDNLSIKKENFESDVIEVSGREFKVSDKPAIYLPDDRIILQISNSNLLSTHPVKD